MKREPFIAHSELTNEIYIIVGKEKYRVTEQAIKAVKAIEALEQEPFNIDTYCKEHFVVMVDKDLWEKAEKALKQEPVFDKIEAEIEQAADKQCQIAMGVSDLNERYAHIQMENAYRHSLNVIDKYKAEVEPQESEE